MARFVMRALSLITCIAACGGLLNQSYRMAAGSLIVAFILWFAAPAKRRKFYGRSTTQIANALHSMQAADAWRDGPATEKQRNYADDLGIAYDPRITSGGLSDLIAQAVESQKGKRDYSALDERREQEFCEATLADIRRGDTSRAPTKKQRELAERLEVPHAPNMTRAELADAIEVKFEEKRVERVRWREEKKKKRGPQ